MKIYFAPNTRAVRVVWLFEELGLPYELERYELGHPAMRSPEFQKIHPLGRVPVLEDGDTRLFESGAIIQYVLARYGDGRLVPATDDSNFSDYLQWFHYAEGMLMPPVNTLVVENVLLPEAKRTPVIADRAAKLLNKMLIAVEKHMTDKEYLAGEFSAADLMTGHACTVAARFGGDLSDKPNVSAYVERLRARPAFQRALEA